MVNLIITESLYAAIECVAGESDSRINPTFEDLLWESPRVIDMQKSLCITRQPRPDMGPPNQGKARPNIGILKKLRDLAKEELAAEKQPPCPGSTS